MGTLTYFALRTIFLAKYKFEKLWKNINNLAILSNLDFQYTIHKRITTNFDSTTKTTNLKSNLKYLVNKTILKAWLKKKDI